MGKIIVSSINLYTAFRKHDIVSMKYDQFEGVLLLKNEGRKTVATISCFADGGFDFTFEDTDSVQKFKSFLARMRAQPITLEDGMSLHITSTEEFD